MPENIELPKWYQSTQGPGVSQTLTNIAGTSLPVLNLVLGQFGWALGEGTIEALVTSAVFIFFAARAAIGYVKAKNILGSQHLSR